MANVLPRADALREELRDAVAVARGRVPRLAQFAESWGRTLVPPILAAPPDVLVVVPHSFLRDLPLHLVTTDDGQPLGARCGISYCSSQSLFARCVTRNPARMTSASTERLTVVAAGADMLTAGDDRFGGLARSISHLLGTEPFTNPAGAVNRSDLKFRLRTSPDKELVCLVMHGYIDAEDHRLSGLLLSGDGGYGHHTMGGAVSTGAPARLGAPRCG